ncbi:hypothetical protein [Gordonia humi]|uniref:Uncharacterized protein n=1 Tax=Gordonia humi TaxID=686429 RepID=A0A840F833_9ACTN|nr:hypothetical protein [Gordonia humi]MBB4138046.1 hypothetical protein [Gordonia humi]
MTGLPAGFRVRVGEGVRVHDGGRTLVGGSPLRVLRLKEPAPALARGDVRDSFARGSAALVVSCRHTWPQPLHR